MCRERATDTLLRQLLDEHDLCLLSNALTPKEIAPGTVITLSTFRQQDRPVRRPFGAIYAPDFAGEVTKARYRPITLSRSNGTLGAELIAKASGMLGDAIGLSEFQAALNASGAKTFDISLGDARRADIDVHAVEQHLRSARMTAAGMELFETGFTFYLVTRTVIAAEVSISGDRESANALGTRLAGLLDGRATVTRRGAAEIVMSPSSQEMVVGFSASRVVEHPDGGYALQGLTKPLRKLDQEDDRLEREPAETFSGGSGDPITAIGLDPVD